jgi:hypothetical protein
METLFLNFVQAINDSRFWLGPLLVVCVFVLVRREIITTVRDETEETRSQRSDI